MLPPLRFADELARAGIPLIVVGMRRGRATLGDFLATVRELGRRDPEVLVCFMYHANLLGRLVGSLARVPRIIVSVRNENFGGRMRDLIFRCTNGFSDVTVVNSELAAESLVGRNVVRQSQLRIIPNGIEVEPEPRTALGRSDVDIPSDAFLWLAAGRLEPQKDYDNLLDAFSRLDERHHLMIAGDGSLAGSLKEKAGG